MAGSCGQGLVRHRLSRHRPGPILAMIENHRSGLVWQVMRGDPHLRRGLEQRALPVAGWRHESDAPHCPDGRARRFGRLRRRADDGRETLRFWAMGREGEVLAQLVPAFERLNPGIRVRIQQIPGSPRTRNCSPPLPAMRPPTSPSWDRAGCPSWRPGRDRAARRAPARLTRRPRRRLFRRPATRQCHRRPYLGIALVCRYPAALLPQRPAPRGRLSGAPIDWAGWLAAMRAIKARAAPGDYCRPAPVERI